MSEAAKVRTYGEAEVVAHLAAKLPHWRFRSGHIHRKFATPDWRATLMVVNAVGFLAEAAFHHPDLAVSFSSVDVSLSSHEAKGITDKDFALAARIDDVVAGRVEGADGPALIKD